MRGILAIAGKDLRSLFFSLLFWIFAGLCTTIWSVLYHMAVNRFAESSGQMKMMGQSEGASLHFQVFAHHISLVNFIMIMAVAALTMRLFAEEKKQRSFDLLLTSPVTATQIVIGKYLAALGGALALVLLSALYPLTTAVLGDIEWGPLFSAYLGLSFMVACYVAVGMFASSLTESVVLAVVMSLIFSVGLWFIGAGTEIADNPMWTAVFEHLNVGTHFGAMVRGSVSLAAVVFFLSVVFLFNFLTQRVVESSRWR